MTKSEKLFEMLEFIREYPNLTAEDLARLCDVSKRGIYAQSAPFIEQVDKVSLIVVQLHTKDPSIKNAYKGIVTFSRSFTVYTSKGSLEISMVLGVWACRPQA